LAFRRFPRHKGRDLSGLQGNLTHQHLNRSIALWELILGLEAKHRLRQLLDEGGIKLDRDGTDRYGRTLVRVLVDGRDIGAVMIREGFALRYQPGAAAAKEARLKKWCGSDARLDDTWRSG
jgi:Staphylococcal nuclease homologue